MRVVVTEAAKADLNVIGEFIRPHNRRRALTFVDELIECCDAIADMPNAYPLVPRYEHWLIRRRVHGDYLIFYRIREEVIEVIHILHGARDYEALLSPDS